MRPGSAFRTKGAVATSFMVFGTSFLFVTAHLTAHQEKVKERVSDVKRIVNSLDLPRVLPCKNKSKGKQIDKTCKLGLELNRYEDMIIFSKSGVHLVMKLQVP